MQNDIECLKAKFEEYEATLAKMNADAETAKAFNAQVAEFIASRKEAAKLTVAKVKAMSPEEYIARKNEIWAAAHAGELE